MRPRISRREQQALTRLFRQGRTADGPPRWTEVCPRCGARVLLEGAPESVWQAVRAAFHAAHGCPGS